MTIDNVILLLQFLNGFDHKNVSEVLIDYLNEMVNCISLNKDNCTWKWSRGSCHWVRVGVGPSYHSHLHYKCKEFNFSLWEKYITSCPCVFNLHVK